MKWSTPPMPSGTVNSTSSLAAARDTGETFDLVVVGCGFAGITAAATYLEGNPDARILLLDNHAIFGGEAKENEFEVDGYRLWGPQGSTGTVFSKDKTRLPLSVHRMWQKLGLPESFEHQELEGTDKDILVPVDVWGPMHARWEDADLGWYFKEHGWIKDPWSNGMRNAPISDNLKNDYYAMELFRRPPRRDDWKQWLDSMTYKEFVMNVMGLSEEVFPYLDPLLAAMGTGLGSDVISAYQAYEFVAPGVHAYRRYQGLGDPTNFSYIASFPGGNGALLRYFVRFLIPDAISGDTSLANMAVYSRVNWEALDRRNAPVKMRLSSTVAAVAHNGPPDMADDVSVTYHKDGELHRVNARHVAVCSGQWVNRYIVRDLPDEHFEAMGRVPPCPYPHLERGGAQLEVHGEPGYLRGALVRRFRLVHEPAPADAVRRQGADAAGPRQTHGADPVHTVHPARHAVEGTGGSFPHADVRHELPGHRDPDPRAVQRDVFRLRFRRQTGHCRHHRQSPRPCLWGKRAWILFRQQRARGPQRHHPPRLRACALRPLGTHRPPVMDHGGRGRRTCSYSISGDSM